MQDELYIWVMKQKKFTPNKNDKRYYQSKPLFDLYLWGANPSIENGVVFKILR